MTTDARFSKQDIDNQGADRLFGGFPMREIAGYDPENGKLRRILVNADGRIETEKANAQVALSNADEVVSSTKTVTKTIGSSVYEKTLSFNAAGDFLSATVWSAV